MSWTRHTSDAELVGGVGRVVQRGMEENGHGGEAVSSYIGRAKKKKGLSAEAVTSRPGNVRRGPVLGRGHQLSFGQAHCLELKPPSKSHFLTF